MAYTPQTWHNKPSVDTPVNRVRLSYIELGLQAAAAVADAALAAAAVAMPAPSGDTSGVADSAAFAAAVTALPTAGGQVNLQAGTYWINAVVSDTTGKSVWFTGKGAASTVIKAASGYTGKVVKLGTKYSSLSHLTVDGNSTATVGISVEETRNKVSNFQVLNVNGDGISLIGNSVTTCNAKVTSGQISGCVNGLHMSGAGGHDSEFTNVTADTCSSNGIYVQGSNNIFTGCHVWGCGTGVKVRFSETRFVECYIDTNTGLGYDVAATRAFHVVGGNVSGHTPAGFSIGTTTQFTIIGTQVENAVGVGILIDSCDSFSIVGVDCFDTQTPKTQTYGMQLSNNTNFAVVGCQSKASDNLTGGINLTGAGNSGYVFRGNPGNDITGAFRKTGGVGGIVPSATAGAFGTAVTISPSLLASAFSPLRMLFQGAGTFASETLTVRITATFSDATTQNITKTFTSSGASAECTLADFYSLMKDGVRCTKLQLDASSTVNSSAATGSYFVLYVNS